MADKRIQDLTAASSVQLNDLFVLEQSGAAKSLTGQVLITDLAAALDGHGGISDITYTAPVAPSLNGTLTLTMADGTTNALTITNGNGIDSITVRYGISNNGTDPTYVSSWSATVVAPTDQYPFMWTRIGIEDTTETVTYAYSVTVKADDPTITIGTIGAQSGPNASVSITNSGTVYDPILDFDFTLPQGDKGDTGDYVEPVVAYGTSTAAATEPTTWYNSPTSLSYAAGNFIWQKTEYTLHDAQTVQSTEVKIIGYIGQNGSGSGTVTQVTFNGTVYADDGTGNVDMTVSAGDVGAIADPATKSNGQVLTYDSTAGEWVATTPSTGSVNTVNNVGVTAGTTNIQLYASNIPMSSSDSTPVSSAIPSASSTTPLTDSGSGVVGTGTTWARSNHRHPLNVPSSGAPADLGTASNGSASTYARSDHVHRMPSASDVGAAPSAAGVPAGGAVGEVLAKLSGDDYNASFQNLWDLLGFTFLPVAINASTTASITCPNNCKFFFVLVSASANARGWGVVNTTSAGAVSLTHSSMSSVTFTAGTNSLAVRPSAAVNGFIIHFIGEAPTIS